MRYRSLPVFVQSIWLMLALFLISGPATASVDLLPANLLISPKASPHHVILVEKSSQRLFVYHFDGEDYRLVATYACITGENSGDKKVKGDRKTPEGIYFFTKAVAGEYLSPIYGDRAFPMNYPNFMDRRLNKNGNGIWVHGTDEERPKQSTNGCIALANKDVVQLDRYVKLWNTPIIIEDKLTYEDRSELRRQAQQLLASIEGWRQAWSRKELDRYLSYYAADFRWKKLDLQAWRSKKERLNRLYKIISVQFSDIHLFRHGNMVLATAEELYRSDRFASRGLKHLYLVQNSPNWRILGEEWRKSNRPGAPPLLMAAKEPAAAVSTQESLRRFVQEWRKSWEEGDLSAYMACYHPQFKKKEMDLQAWKAYKDKLFKATARRIIQLQEINVEVRGSAALVVCKQRYQADTHQDYGVKTLNLRRHNGRWTIHRETWQPLPEQG